VCNTGDWLISEQRSSWDRYYATVSKVRWVTAWHTAAWAIFAAAYVAAIVYVATGLDRGVGDVVLVLAAGTRLARYVGDGGWLGFLRGFWLDSSRRLARLEDYAAGIRSTSLASRRHG
jgi:ATP-binding cassette subfamily B protein